MKNKRALILVLVLIIPACFYLFGPGYFNMHDDLQIMRIFQMEKCFDDGQIPCRWSPDMAYGYGQAMFNFYSVFPYYLGVLIRMLIPLSLMGTARTLFLISLITAAIGMYYLVKEFWGKTAGILAAVLYTYAPYHALDVYVRGAMSESYALAILPFLWLSFYLLIKEPNYKRVVATAVMLTLLLTTHNISVMLYTPFTLIWVGYWLVSFKKVDRIKSIALAGLLGIGLSAFFTFPLIVEKPLIQTQFLTMDYLDYTAHFVTFSQLFFDRSWGHGPSIFGPYDEISFQIGWPHWWLAIIVSLYAAFWLLSKKRRRDGILLSGLLVASSLTVFLTHSRSTPFWLKIPIMSFIQFPWRFLGLVMFFLSFAGAALARPKCLFRRVKMLLLVFLVIILNVGYFKPWNRVYTIRDDDKFSRVAFEIQQKSAILDYLPKTAPIAPKEIAPNNPVIKTGEGRAYNFSKRSNSFFFDAEIYEDAQVKIPVMYFPGWKVIVGGKVTPSVPSGDYGVITITLPEGKHIVQGRFENTSARSVGNVVSVITAISIFAGCIFKENKRKFLWL